MRSEVPGFEDFGRELLDNVVAFPGLAGKALRSVLREMIREGFQSFQEQRERGLLCFYTVCTVPSCLTNRRVLSDCSYGARASPSILHEIADAISRVRDLLVSKWILLCLCCLPVGTYCRGGDIRELLNQGAVRPIESQDDGRLKDSFVIENHTFSHVNLKRAGWR